MTELLNRYSIIIGENKGNGAVKFPPNQVLVNSKLLTTYYLYFLSAFVTKKNI